MRDRTSDFRFHCKERRLALQRKGPDPPLPAPPFSFTETDLAKPPTASIPGPDFSFLRYASMCVEEQASIHRQLHPHRQGELPWQSAVLSSTPSDASRGAPVEVAALLSRVRHQQEHLQRLEEALQQWDDVLQLSQRRQAWEDVFWENRHRPHPTPRSAVISVIDKDSAAAAHRHAVIGCLYATLQDLTAELKMRELALLRGQVYRRRYFSASSMALSPPQAAVRGARTNARSLLSAEQLGAAAVAAVAARAAEKVSSGLLNSGQATAAGPIRTPPRAGEEEVNAAASLQAEDVSQLRQEEQQLLETLASDADVLQEVQLKLQEIIKCMDVFSAKVIEQSEACEHIQQLADAAVSNVEGAAGHLTDALKRTSSYRYYVVSFFVVAGLVVLLLDFMKSSSPYLP
ncbi:hypothetical protein CSUI_000161 [Cystoisospora suis]|uniref:Transmembrane protein n=1 Tax=Cystoisospora suis TaxID=483139 RepID=A0A2C6LHI3_9APIC|nr:hypothetical protein CSUI_000161 [Cystoisospora suis]